MAVERVAAMVADKHRQFRSHLDVIIPVRAYLYAVLLTAFGASDATLMLFATIYAKFWRFSQPFPFIAFFCRNPSGAFAATCAFHMKLAAVRAYLAGNKPT
jgi:hypothetical protein